MPMLPNSSLGILFFKALIFSFLSILTKTKLKNSLFTDCLLKIKFFICLPNLRN
jgi:hypothetical protein